LKAFELVVLRSDLPSEYVFTNLLDSTFAWSKVVIEELFPLKFYAKAEERACLVLNFASFCAFYAELCLLSIIIFVK